MKDLVPMLDRVVVKLRKEKESNGVLIPEDVQLGPIIADVLAVGPGRYDNFGSHIPPTVKPGDVVMIADTGIAVELDGEKFEIVREHDILCIITE